MFKIEELLQLFENNEVKRIILSSYMLSQTTNKELSNKVFEQLFFLKKTYPEIEIKIDRNSTSPSHYYDNAIYLNGCFDEVTFFHELAHLLSFFYFKFSIPKEYIDFKNDFLISQEKQSLIVTFVELCHEKIKKLFEDLGPNFLNKNNNEYTEKDELFNNKTFAPTEETLIQISIIVQLQDIIDSITSGKSSDLGLKYLDNNNDLIKKAHKGIGHGCEYFSNSEKEFEEIIADYYAINLIDPDNELFNLLKIILGAEFIEFLDNRCQSMSSGKITYLDLNEIKNIHK